MNGYSQVLWTTINRFIDEFGIRARQVIWIVAPFAGCPVAGATAGGDFLYERGLNIPSSVGLSDYEQARVIEAIRRRP